MLSNEKPLALQNNHTIVQSGTDLVRTQLPSLHKLISQQETGVGSQQEKSLLAEQIRGSVVIMKSDASKIVQKEAIVGWANGVDKGLEYLAKLSNSSEGVIAINHLDGNIAEFVDLQNPAFFVALLLNGSKRSLNNSSRKNGLSYGLSNALGLMTVDDIKALINNACKIDQELAESIARELLTYTIRENKDMDFEINVDYVDGVIKDFGYDPKHMRIGGKNQLDASVANAIDIQEAFDFNNEKFYIVLEAIKDVLNDLYVSIMTEFYGKTVSRNHSDTKYSIDIKSTYGLLRVLKKMGHSAPNDIQSKVRAQIGLPTNIQKQVTLGSSIKNDLAVTPSNVQNNDYITSLLSLEEEEDDDENKDGDNNE